MRAGQKNRTYIRETTLDLTLATSIVSNGFLEPPGDDSTANLRQFKSIHPDAIRYLSRFNYAWVDFGLEELSPLLAREIAAWRVAGISFADGMASCSEALYCFDRSQASLSFGDIGDALDLQSVTALGRGQRYLGFAATQLSPQVAGLIARHPGRLEIKLKQPIVAETLQMLAAHFGDQCLLYLNQPITMELLLPLIQNNAIRYFDLSGLVQHTHHESALLLCKPTRYSEIMSFSDLPSALALGPNC